MTGISYIPCKCHDRDATSKLEMNESNQCRNNSRNDIMAGSMWPQWGILIEE